MIFLRLLFLLINVEAYKYLMYNPVFAPSHVMFGDKIAQTLKQAGHIVIQLNPVQTTNFDLKKLEHKDNWIRWPKTVKLDDKVGKRWASEMWEVDSLSLEELFRQFHDIGVHHAEHCADLIQDEEYLQKLRDVNFDLAITEFFDICGLGIFEKIGIRKYIALSPTPNMHHITAAFGIPSLTSSVPDLSTVSAPDMSFSVRVSNFLSPWLVGSVSKWSLVGYTEQVIREHVNPNFNALDRFGEASYFFVNIDAIIDFNRPISDKIQYIGGMGNSGTSNKPLEPKFQKIMDGAKDGVILVSFGTIALSYQMPPQIKQVFLEAFNEFPSYTFLWKYERPEDNIAANYSNVVDVPWVPQLDIFSHPKLRGFITHGGLNSITEAAYGGVPVITIGLFGDQQRNAKMAEYRGFGVNMEKASISKETLVAKLKELIENDSYRRKAKEIAEMLRSKPHSAEETLVKYTEYATKFDVHSYLDMHGRHLGFVQYYSVDVVAFLFVVCTLILLSLYASVKLIVFVCRHSPLKKIRNASRNSWELFSFIFNMFNKNKLD